MSLLHTLGHIFGGHLFGCWHPTDEPVQDPPKAHGAFVPERAHPPPPPPRISLYNYERCCECGRRRRPR